MKKTLMVLSFALCATFAFAQTSAPRTAKEYKAPAKAQAVQDNYKSSIFTKDATPLLSVDFSAANTGYTTGTVTTGSEAHGENYDYATWRRLNSADSAYLATQVSVYSALAQNYFGGAATFCSYLSSYMDTADCSSDNGFMMMSLYDQRTPNSGNFNAYIQLNTVDASAASLIDVELYQYYRKYYDLCYIDYSADGTTWNETEINVTGIDLAVNGALRGVYTYTLPAAAAGNANLSIRIRYKSLNSNRGDYGYYWCIDDVKVIAGPEDRFNFYAQEYTEGAYGLLPQGLNSMNVAWYCQVKNTGVNDQANTTATVNHLDENMENASVVASYNNGGVARNESAYLVADPAGYLPVIDSMKYVGWYGYSTGNASGTGVNVPTATAGEQFLYAAISSDNLEARSYDTILYTVTTADANGNYVWGHDNGVLIRRSYWMFGYTYQGGNWYVTEDPDEVDYYAAGYSVTSRYTAPTQVPEGWVIRGVELVPATDSRYIAAGTKISGVLMTEEYEGSSVGFPVIETGAGVHSVAASELNDSTSIANQGGFATIGNYNTVRIMFPEQPALEANKAYRVGYSIEEEGAFTVAHEALGVYYISATEPGYDSILRFRNNEATKRYAHRFPVNQYSTYFIDAVGPEGNQSTFASWHVDNNPMIRLLVGPAQQVNRVNVQVICTDTNMGQIVYAGAYRCNETVTPVEGGSPTFSIVPAQGIKVVSVLVDGQAVEPWDEDTESGDPNLVVYTSGAYAYTFANIQGDHTISATFAIDEGEESIDPVAANVRMNLQPNPATSQVSLNIEGVSGMVNCMLIDMSGRVVYSAKMNAESAQVINLSNLAKGAYFVRITNNEFSKVEKLIVR